MFLWAPNASRRAYHTDAMGGHIIGVRLSGSDDALCRAIISVVVRIPELSSQLYQDGSCDFWREFADYSLTTPHYQWILVETPNGSNRGYTPREWIWW